MIDPAKRIEELLDEAEPEFSAAFLSMVALIKDEVTLTTLAELLSQGRVEDAMRGLEKAATRLGTVWAQTYSMSGTQTAQWLQSHGIEVHFDVTNEAAVAAMRENQLRMVAEFSAGQRAATRQALMDGIARGNNPRQQARAFRDSIGLTQSQVEAVENYRRALERGSLSALRRELRDRRFDPTVRAAARDGRQLTQEQILRMVERYQERLLKHRAEVIARTEALRSVHQGVEATYAQAIASGDLDPSMLSRKWNTAGDHRVRDTHRSMQGQERPWGTPFTAGSGASLRYPGDINAPGSETIQCRCAVSTRINLSVRGPIGIAVLEG